MRECRSYYYIVDKLFDDSVGPCLHLFLILFQVTVHRISIKGLMHVSMSDYEVKVNFRIWLIKNWMFKIFKH